jgi:glycogen operon protein
VTSPERFQEKCAAVFRPEPRPDKKLGARPAARGFEFAVQARQAHAVELCLFEGERETRFAMARDGEIFAVTLPVEPGQKYGLRAHGPWLPEQGLFFDPSKLLVDPYATQLDRRFVYDARLSQYGVDTAALVPKAVVTAPLTALAPRAPFFAPGGLIYELNVRGFSMKHPEVPAHLRGTIAALALPSIIDHFRKLHVSAVELMPAVAWIDERHLPPLGLHNAWGYNPVVPMALDPGLAPGGLAELRDTVVTLHDAGIGVILDLVLNHTGESDLEGPILSLRGLDNECYACGPDGVLTNYSGTGNMLNAADPSVQAMILETLRHFVRGAGVDGFRFDLAPILARSPVFDPHASIFTAIAVDPLLQDRVMIAEPWDLGPGGYQLGHFPDSWLEWNDRYRDDVRRFWRGDRRSAGALATRILGSSDIFSGQTTRSVNFIAAHDGFSLADLTAYSEKHNAANGEENRDGSNENFSWNNGVEGPSSDPSVLQRRRADIKALLATLFLSRGAIQLTAGDEFGHSRQGNNNAYAQDNGITWLDWEGRDLELAEFAAECARIRDSALRSTNFVGKACWYDLDGEILTPQKWDSDELEGFEVHIEDKPGPIVIRIDRRTRSCSVRFP